MKPILKCFVLIVLLSSSSIGQTPVDSVNHKFGLRFIIDGFRLGGGLGAKLWLSKTSALGISLTGRAEAFNYPNSTNGTRSIYLRADYEYHFLFAKDLSLFGIASPTIGLGESEYNGTSYVSYIKYWQLGMAVGVGIEYWIGENVSFSANQSIAFYDTFYTSEDRETQILTLSDSRAILSFYF